MMSPMSIPALPRWRRGLVASACGVGLALAFPPYGLASGWVAVPLFAALVATFRGLTWRGGALVGLAAGGGFFLVLLSWIRVLGPDAWVALSLLCTSFWAALGAVLPWLLRRPGWVLSVPLAWTTMEGLRERVPWGGFPWGRLAFAQADTVLVGWAALGGPALASFAVALAGAGLLAAVDAFREGRAARAVVPALLVGSVVLGGAALRISDWGGPIVDTQPVAIVQGNVPRLGLDFNAQRRAVLDNHVRVTEELAAEVAAGRQQQPVAVVWPENSSDLDPLRSPDAAAQIDRAARSIGAPILVGTLMDNPADPRRDDHPGTVLNVGLVWDPVTGPGQSYVKRHPVPFGEYLPMRGLLSRVITRFDRIPRDFAAGTQPGVLQVGPVPAGVVICFEIAYDELVRDAVRAGGSVLVVQTNNATYGRTGQPEQQLAISQVQAVASGRTTLVAATSGISAVIDPHGRVVWRTEEFTSDATVVDVALRVGQTPAVRLGDLVELSMALALILAVAVVARTRPRTGVSVVPAP